MILVSAFLFMGCRNEELDGGLGGYGYVQFHLYKTASYVKSAANNQLEYLSDAAKVKVTLKTSSNDVLSPTLTVDAPDKTMAEWGMQTDKILLLAGEYQLTSYQVLDALDETIFTAYPDEPISFTVVSGGLVSRDLVVDTQERGKVNFILVKDIPALKSAGSDDYPFYMISSVDLTITNKLDNSRKQTITNLPMVHEFVEKDGYITAVCRTDSLVSVTGGEWKVTAYKTYFDSYRKVYKTVTEVADNSFNVIDNGVVDAEVPISLDLSSVYIQDAMTIKEIFDDMDGENWKVKWNFDCDVDIWTAQPGISILEDGRVAAIDFEGLGAKGDLSPAIGKLTELRSLLLGSHSFYEGNSNITLTSKQYTPLSREEIRERRESFTRTFVNNNTDSYGCFSEELRWGLKMNNVPLSEKTAPLKSYPTENSPFNYATAITSLPDEINNLDKLQTLYIGYSPIKRLPSDMSNMKALIDVEMFFLPDLEEFPMGLATLPSLETLTFSCNFGISPESMYEGLKAMNAGNVSKSLQAFYMPAQKVHKIPDMRGFKKLGLLNIQDCGAYEFEAPFGKDHYFVNLYADNNNFSSLPTDEYGFFVGIDANTETIGFAHNKFTAMPDIFDAKSVYTMGTMDFSNNQISSFAGFNGGKFRGMNCNSLNLSYNQLTSWPRELTESQSAISAYMLAGNKIQEITEEDIEHKYSYLTTTIDLSYNMLSSLPNNFDALTYPFLYGLDLSYNRFTQFPYTAVNNQYLTVFIFRHQRDAAGNRCMKQWPTGIGGALVGLRALYLGSNDIRVVNDELSYLIYNLDISDNPRIVIDVSSVCSYIAAGYFNLIYSPDQDIRGCDDYLNLN